MGTTHHLPGPSDHISQESRVSQDRTDTQGARTEAAVHELNSSVQEMMSLLKVLPQSLHVDTYSSA